MIFQVSDEKRNKLLVQAMCEILLQCSNSKFRIVYQNIPSVNNVDQNSIAPVNSRTPDSSEIDILDTAEVLEKQNLNKKIIDPVQFHGSLNVQILSNITDVENYYTDNTSILMRQYGVLLFLYSVLMTKVSLYLMFIFFVFEINYFKRELSKLKPNYQIRVNQ